MVKRRVAPDYTYLRSGMQYVHWLGYNVKLCCRSFEHQWKNHQGSNASWDVYYRLLWDNKYCELFVVMKSQL